jgi:hypothetical protein|uniref:Uncharacterized protein n=2 Tax=Ostreococcus mediterraneus TaxID=1486918 RepID=A0A7S0KI65_9CHLO
MAARGDAREDDDAGVGVDDEATDVTALRSLLADVELTNLTHAKRIEGLTNENARLRRELIEASECAERAGEERERREVRWRRASEALGEKFSALERRVMDTELLARRRAEEAKMVKSEYDSVKRALDAANREIGKLQVETVGGRSAALESAQLDYEREKRRLAENVGLIREELDDAKRRVSVLEAHAREAKRVLGEALDEDFPERVDVSVAARRAANALNSFASSSALHKKPNSGALKNNDADGVQRQRRRASNYDEEDYALDAETEAALEEALTAARRWKSIAEREQNARNQTEEDLERMRVKLEECTTALNEMKVEKLESDKYEVEIESIVETLRDRINSLQDSL